jgi:hypothetical protein
VRRSALVAGAVLTAVLALVAVPGLVGSRTPSSDQPEQAVAFQALRSEAPSDGSTPVIRPLDAAYRSEGYLEPTTPLVEPVDAREPIVRPKVKQPKTSVGSTWKPARYSVSGWATWYDNGTTAMRLPRGTTVVICGNGGCLERTVTDYGPRVGHRPVRIADLMPGDFVRSCGCGLWEGTQYVTIRVY